MKIRSALKKIIAVVIITAMMPFAAITANADTLTQDEEGYYLIDTELKLQQFADIVNRGNTTACAKLTGSIRMLEIDSWNPIGCDSAHAFNGTFDGNHKEIYAFTCERDADYIGIFGYTGENSVIKNFSIGFDVTISGGSYVGGIAGYNKGVISACSSEGTISASGDYAGGIAGYNEGQIIDCSNGGQTSGGSYVGGIAGYSTGEIKNSRAFYSNVSGISNVGGIAGYSSAKIENCFNINTVNGSVQVGGIAGYSSAKIENCYNTGTVTGNGTDVMKIGGIAGESAGNIENSYNTGTVTGNSKVGGIAGENAGDIIKCYNTATINGDGNFVGGIAGEFSGQKIESCYNTGSVNANNVVDAGGIAGAAYQTDQSSLITACFNTGFVSSRTNTGGIIGTNCCTVSNCYNTGEITTKLGQSGGIAGRNAGTVRICYNTGKVEAAQYVGGIVGYNSPGNVTSCYNTAAVEGNDCVGGIAGGWDHVISSNDRVITDCYNIGSVSGNSNCGSIAGLRFSGTVRNCYFDESVNCDSFGTAVSAIYSYNVTGLSATEMTGTDALSAMKMSDSSVWMTKADGIGTEGTYYFYYPHLKGFNFKDESGTRVEFPMGIDESCEQTEASDITASAWPPKTEVKVTCIDVGPFKYNGSDQYPRVAEVKVGDVVLEPVTDYTVSINNSEGSVEHSINAGKYKLLVTIGSHAPIEKEYEILKKPLTVAADSAVKIYDGTPLTKDTYTNTALAEGDSIKSVTVTGSQITVGSSENEPSAAKIVNSKGADVTSSYDITYANGTLEVTQRHVTITTVNDEKVYDGTPLTNNSFTYTTLAEGDSIESVTVTGSQITVGSSENVPSAAKIVNSTGADVTSSYEITYHNGTLEVVQRHATVTAGSDAKVYDGTPLTKDTYTNTALAEGDSIESLTVKGSQITVGSSENEPSAAKIVNSTGADVTSSYDITYANGTLEVTQRHVTITTASDEKVYDGTPLANSSFTYTALAEGDSITGIEIIGSQTGVGSSENILQSTATIVNAEGDDVTSNYDITYEYGTLKVTSRSITVRVESAKKVYDGTPLTATITCDGLAEGYAFRAEVEESQTDVGSCTVGMISIYIYDVNGNDVTSSFEITREGNGTLTVTPKPITITAASDSKICDDTPLENGSYTNTELVEGDSIESVTVKGSQTEPGSAENVPSEAKIVNSEGKDVTANYDITYENGTLTVTDKRTLTITAADSEKVYDGSELTNNSYTSTELAEGDTIESLTVTGSQTDAGSCENVPSAAKIVDAEGNDVTATYDITYESGTLTVNPAKVTVKADDKSKVYGDKDPDFTATVSGLVDGEDESMIRFSITRAEGANVGEYEITPAGETEQGNYEVTYEPGKLTISSTSPEYEELPEDAKPTAKELAENGEEQALIEAPANVPDGYTVQYSTDGGTTWTEEIPTGNDPGEYSVMVRYKGDENHDDFNGETLTAAIKAVYTVIWRNGDGSELDRKTYVEGEEEPATDKTPVKGEDVGNTYKFKAWLTGKNEDNVKIYEPEFTAAPKEVIVPRTGDSSVVCWAFVSCAALLGMIFIPICGRRRAKQR